VRTVAVTGSEAALSLGIAGGGKLNIAGGGDLAVGQKLTVGSGGTLQVSPGGSFSAGTLNIAYGGKTSLAGGTASKAAQVGSLTIVGGAAPAARLDLGNMALVVDGTKTSCEQVKAWLTSGYNFNAGDGPLWQGPGISSSAAANDSAGWSALAYGRGSEVFDAGGNPYTTWFGRPTNDNSVLVRYTYYGDSDMDGQVTISDYFMWKSGFNDPTLEQNWVNGDFDYSGSSDITDFFMWKSSFNAMLPNLPPPAGAAAAVPEPGTLVLLALAAVCGLLAMRARRKWPRVTA
jgi:hypothetical protein